MSAELVTALLIAILGSSVIAALVTFLSSRGLNRASSVELLADATEKIIGPLTARVNELETELHAAQAEIKQMKKSLALLKKERHEMIAFIIENGLDWPPT